MNLSQSLEVVQIACLIGLWVTVRQILRQPRFLPPPAPLPPPPPRMVEAPESPAPPSESSGLPRTPSPGGVARVFHKGPSGWIPGEFVREGSERWQYALDTPGLAVMGDGNQDLTMGKQ